MLGDTIFATASPPGAARRGIIRISGPDARPLANRILTTPIPPRLRTSHETTLTVQGYPVPVFALSMPGPNSFTGEDTIELHLPGSPLLLARIQDQLRASAARDATPGEFTRRAFNNHRLTLAEAEAVSDLIHAASTEQRRFALAVLQGGLSRAIDDCRGAIQDGLALLEAGLDFEAGDTGEVHPDAWLSLFDRAHAQLTSLHDGVPHAHAVGDVLLLGAANAGKSSLCNALSGTDAVLIGDHPGTTRDVLVVEIGEVSLLDAPGDLCDPNPTDRAALELRDRLAARTPGALLVVDSTAPIVPRTDLPILAVVLTKCDLMDAPDVAADIDLPGGAPAFRVSNLDGSGIVELREFLIRKASRGPCGGAARIAAAVAAASSALAQAIDAGRNGCPPEAVACDVAAALAALDAVHGRSSPEALLDRIFGAFCLGK